MKCSVMRDGGATVTPMRLCRSAEVLRLRLAVSTTLLVIAASLPLAGCTEVAYQPGSEDELEQTRRPSMTIPSALQKIRDGLQHAGIRFKEIWTPWRYEYRDIEVSFTQFSYTETDYRDDIQQSRDSYSFRYSDLNDLAIEHWSGRPDGYHVTGLNKTFIWWENPDFEYARDFVDAVNALRYYSSSSVLSDDAPMFAQFQEQARAWRERPVRPALPEAVRRLNVLAEDAIQHKNFEEAIDYYEQGLTVTPLWPEGQFNVALLYGELQIYGQAALHTKRYLELSPNAPDAQAARDKMIVWEERAKHTGARSSIGPQRGGGTK